MESTDTATPISSDQRKSKNQRDLLENCRFVFVLLEKGKWQLERKGALKALMAVICPESWPGAGISSGAETKVPRPSAEQRFDPATSVLRRSGTSGPAVKMWILLL